ncbi:MAG: response regulator transcription factor [Deltaproteobacteria bacterium]|nr:response regulator transcription factor [Deltaproteobacteria bacterium]
MTRILVIDDETDLLDSLEYALSKEGFDVVTAADGSSGLATARAQPLPDLLVLDLMLPDMSGLEVCRKLRSHDDTVRLPILMLTARGEEIDRVLGFEMGADDYVVKPFSTRELILRIKALLRRGTETEKANDFGAEQFGVLKVEREAHQVYVNDDEVVLTALEFKLLDHLMRAKGRVQSREVLLRDVWDIAAQITTRTVDTHVKRLREKLGAAGEYIETVRGAGYRFRRKEESAPSS